MASSHYNTRLSLKKAAVQKSAVVHQYYLRSTVRKPHAYELPKKTRPRRKTTKTEKTLAPPLVADKVPKETPPALPSPKRRQTTKELWENLRVAVKKRNLNEIRKLVEQGAPLHYEDRTTALELAIVCKDDEQPAASDHAVSRLEVVRLLVELGALDDAKDGGWSAIELATRCHDIVCYLLRMGAEVPIASQTY